MIAPASTEVFERIYHGWDDALSHLTVDNVEHLLSFYAPDAILESPLVPHLLKTPTGVLQGHDELHRLLQEFARTQPPTRKFFRTGYMTDGEKLMWEYPRATPQCDQQDFVEVMEINDGLIQRHRVFGDGLALVLFSATSITRKKRKRVGRRLPVRIETKRRTAPA